MESGFGTSYVFEGPLETPSGNQTKIRSIWIVRPGEMILNLVTAYPMRTSKNVSGT
jgi:hypothetical protein